MADLMASVSSIVLFLDAEPAGSGYRVRASGPLGEAGHEVAEEAVAALASEATASSGETGRRLYEALFASETGALLRRHREHAQRQRKLLRIVFRLQSRSDDWPVERALDPVSGETLSLMPEIALVRNRPDWRGGPVAAVGTPLKVLLVMPEPVDASDFGAPALWHAIDAGLRPAAEAGRVRLVRAAPATERAVGEALETESWNVVHFAGQGSSRRAARYGTLDFEGSDGRKRTLTAANFARLCAKCPGLNLVVLQAVGGAPGRRAFEVVTLTLMGSGMRAVLWLPDLSEPALTALFARELYAALAAGSAPDRAAGQARRAVAAAGRRSDAPWGETVLFVGAPLLDETAVGPPVALMAPQAAAPCVEGPAVPAPALGSGRASAGEPAADSSGAAPSELERKRAEGEFDVFLCHNVSDKGAVKEIGRRLMERGILPWLDEWELRPGVPWQQLLEEQITQIRSAAVFVGAEGIGPWQRQELNGFLREFAQRHCPVIPVLLTGAPREPRLPLFLKGMTWVDFRVSDPNPLERLIWGITGRRPELK